MSSHEKNVYRRVRGKKTKDKTSLGIEPNALLYYLLFFLSQHVFVHYSSYCLKGHFATAEKTYRVCLEAGVFTIRDKDNSTNTFAVPRHRLGACFLVMTMMNHTFFEKTLNQSDGLDDGRRGCVVSFFFDVICDG